MWHLEMASGVRGKHHGWGGISGTTLVGFKVGHLVLSFDAKIAVIVALGFIYGYIRSRPSEPCATWKCNKYSQSHFCGVLQAM
jgi:hypothetical protein